jgi:hypothetical protein
LREIQKRASRDEGDDSSQGDENGSEQQQHRNPFTPEKAPTKGEIGPGERRDQRTFETGEDEEQIKQDERPDDTLEHYGQRVAKSLERLRQEKE